MRKKKIEVMLKDKEKYALLKTGRVYDAEKISDKVIRIHPLGLYRLEYFKVLGGEK